ncbi:DUF6404 family protein [Vibrio plantisponsor]|uniref:DUF6404 family protein n=1 Tax=Vibrio plantisponsor TaxID=664643 RepID=A0ABU4IKY8_9VIBR|nr:DUF6404 family protein [Vibrio plantisponsor]MDW6019226.1 DUF6404 family protein [Vibrio plantisponsor]
MEISEFIKLYLIEKGVPRDLTKPHIDIFSRWFANSSKPLVFQSPIKTFFKQMPLYSLTWGSLMWFTSWSNSPEEWITYIVSSLLFGAILGLYHPCRIHMAHKKLGAISWEEWCSSNYGFTHPD